VRVHLCGVRGSTPALGSDFSRYGGHTSCLAIAHDDQATPSLILDAGTGIRKVTQLLAGGPFRGSILLSHLHWDHVQGLPFFAAGDRDDSHATLLLPEQEDRAEASAVLSRAMSPPHFPIEPSQLRGWWTFATIAPGKHEVEGFSVLAREIPHKGGRTFGYRVSDDHSTLTYMPDHCPTSLGAGPDGCGEYHQAALDLAVQTDTLVHDSQLVTYEELIKEGRFGHAVADYAVKLGRHVRARHVMLAHHRPDRSDEELDELGRRFEGTLGIKVTIAAQDTVLLL
jgi:phosphoribosyl 1,2-cyclic phosphodiesterase